MLESLPTGANQMTERQALLMPLASRECLPGTLYRFSVAVSRRHVDIAVDPSLAMSGRLRRDIDIRAITLSQYRQGKRLGRWRVSVWIVPIKPMRMYASVQILIPV
jgi:hypothetical protein